MELVRFINVHSSSSSAMLTICIYKSSLILTKLDYSVQDQAQNKLLSYTKCHFSTNFMQKYFDMILSFKC